MTLLRQGLTNREISDVLNYSPKTVEAYLGRLYRKAGCRSRVELVLAMERGKLTDDEPGEAAATGAGRR